MFTIEEADALMKDVEWFRYELTLVEPEDPTMMELTESERSAIEKIARFDPDMVYTREEAYAILELLEGLETMTLLGGWDLIKSAKDKLYKFLEQFQPPRERSLDARLEDLKELEKEFLVILESDLPNLKKFERISYLLALVLEHRLPPDSIPEQEKLQAEIERVYLRLCHACPERYRP